jgi:hypothetical protein
MRRLSWLALCAIVAGMTGGCGDDDGMTGDDGGTDGGSTNCPDDPEVPNPAGLMGACCYRQSNADRLDAPEFRLAGLKLTAPMSLDSIIVRQLLTDALDFERFNWIFRLSISGSNVDVTTGYGERNGDDTFSFVMGGAPGPGAADRWDPLTATGTISGETVMTMAIGEPLTVPVFDETGTMLTAEFPLHDLVLTMATMSEDRSCVGTRSAARYETDAASLEAFIQLEQARDTRIVAPPIDTSLCMFLAGMASDAGNCETAQDTWLVPPDSTCDAAGCSFGGCEPATCNAWQVRAEFAAHSVEITD